ncbi:MAG: energy-coupling factor transporter transmembrane protein EcfT [Rhodococcus sp.]|uniref:energy-coupling factor transporter transmembrane component T family protein n=1 Tax=Rhodococcus TaxID=1827 RepID=UPI0016A563F4|nr:MULTISPECIES: energy-coupling factor transporter transmembrane protein EcfT [Rhodococcus]NLV79584.1 energy-coupling factor transporter transmembrane protein EcfT [Rhodococcus sp. (in: high G+C Gram-positive bacteria)]
MGGARRRRPVILLRPVPRPSPLHRVWAGTKILAVAALSVVVSFHPSWAGIGMIAVVLAVAVAVARIPRGVVPSIPWWVYAIAVVGAVLNASGGGLDAYARTVLLGVALLVLMALVGWTTRLSELVDALPVLFAPLRRMRLPVDEWVTTCALALRMLPTIRGELRMVFAARRLRGRVGVPSARESWREIVDSVGAVASVSMRQAQDLGEALSVRGPRPTATARPRVGVGDVVVAVVVAAVCVAMWLYA